MQDERPRVFAVTWIAYAGFYLCRKNFSVAIPLLIAQEGVAKGDLANAVAIFSLAYAVGQFTMGGLADRLGARRVVSLGLLLSILATAAMGFWHGALLLCALQAVNGLAQASGWPGLVKIMGAWFGKAQRGVVMAWWCTNYALGGFLATLFTTWVVTHPDLLPELGWQRAMWAPAAALAAVAIVFAFCAKEAPAASRETTGSRFSWALVREVVANARIQRIAIVYALLKLVRYSFLMWLPLYMTEQLSYSAADAGYSSSVFELAGFLGAIAAGYISDRLFASRRFPAAGWMLAALGLMCLLHPALAAWSPTGNLIGISLIGMMIYGPDTLLGGAAVQDVAPRNALATAAGTVNGVGSLGQLVSPWIVVFIAEQYGWNNLFYFFAALALAGCGLLMVSRLERSGTLAHEPAR